MTPELDANFFPVHPPETRNTKDARTGRLMFAPYLSVADEQRWQTMYQPDARVNVSDPRSQEPDRPDFLTADPYYEAPGIKSTTCGGCAKRVSVRDTELRSRTNVQSGLPEPRRFCKDYCDDNRDKGGPQ